MPDVDLSLSLHPDSSRSPRAQKLAGNGPPPPQSSTRPEGRASAGWRTGAEKVAEGRRAREEGGRRARERSFGEGRKGPGRTTKRKEENERKRNRADGTVLRRECARRVRNGSLTLRFDPIRLDFLSLTHGMGMHDGVSQQRLLIAAFVTATSQHIHTRNASFRLQ